MKYLGVMFLIPVLLFGSSFKINIQELALMTSQANHINIMLDPKIDLTRNFYFYDDFNPSLSQQSLKVILESNGLELQRFGNVYYISNTDNNITFYDHIKIRNVTNQDVKKLSNFYGIKTTALGNSEIIVKYTDKKKYLSFKRYLKEISTPKHIYLEGEIIAVNETKLNDVGIDFASLASNIIKVGNLDLGLITNINGNDFVKQIISSNELTNIGDITAFVSLLKETGAATVVTRPNMLVMDGKTSEFKAGQQIRIVESSVDSVRNSGEYASKQYKMLDVGLTLKCKANIVNDKASLDFEFTISDLTEYKPTLDRLIIDNKTYTSTFNLIDGEEIVLAGLTASTVIHKTSALPFLSDIPFIGEIFKHNYDEKENISYLIYFKGTIK